MGENTPQKVLLGRLSVQCLSDVQGQMSGRKLVPESQARESSRTGDVGRVPGEQAGSPGEVVGCTGGGPRSPRRREKLGGE